MTTLSTFFELHTLCSLSHLYKLSKKVSTMSIALESTSGNSIQRSGFIHSINMPCKPGIFAGDGIFPAREVEDREGELGSCSSSSIGKNSDFSSDGEDSGESEVQSSYKGPLDTMDALEEVLPIRRGISKFYHGKSKSFTSLADVSSCSSIKDLAKPENCFTRKRKNLLANNKFWDKSHNCPLRNNSRGMSKRPANSSRSTLALAASMGSAEGNISEETILNSSSPPPRLPPLHPQNKRSTDNGSPSPPHRQNLPSWRSLSLSDLQCVAGEHH